MSTIKPIIEPTQLLDLLATCFQEPVSDVQPLAGGQIAQAYSFSAAGADYVIRFNTGKMDVNFEKEEYIACVFASQTIPIPAVIQVGRLEDLHYCISRKMEGRRLNQLSAEEVSAALPAVLDTLDAIHGCHVSHQPGWGLFDGRGQGFFASWPASLAFVAAEERPDGFYGKWHDLFDTTFLERSLFDQVYGRMVEHFAFCPQDRWLVHGGYGFGNLLIADGRVTAVLDWLDAKYGDFLYDVAWLDFWDPGRGYPALVSTRYARQGKVVPDFPERILCYECCITLDALRFFAKTNQPHAYGWARQRILDLLANGTRS